MPADRVCAAREHVPVIDVNLPDMQMHARIINWIIRVMRPASVPTKYYPDTLCYMYMYVYV